MRNLFFALVLFFAVSAAHAAADFTNTANAGGHAGISAQTGVWEAGSVEGAVLFAKAKNDADEEEESADEQDDGKGLGDTSDEDAVTRYVKNLLARGNTKRALGEVKKLLRSGDTRVKSRALYLEAMVYAEDFKYLRKAPNVIADLRAWDPNSPYLKKLETVMLYRYLQFRINNNVPQIQKSRTVVDIKSERPLTFVYQDEKGKQDTIKFPPDSVCVNEDCVKFESRVMRDRAVAGRYQFTRECREWSNYARAVQNDDAVDRKCVMTIKRTDLGL